MSFFLYFSSLFLGGLGASSVGYAGRRWGLLDHPNERSSHQASIPKGGGIGILGGFCLVSLFLQIPLKFWVPAASLSFLSLWGDRMDFSPWFRLVLQFAAAFIMLSGINEMGFLLKVSIILLLSVFAVGTANFYNFMDGINGIAAITGIVGFGLLGISNFLSEGDKSLAVLSICVSLSCLGFLPFNLPQARVFMGDVGSILLGFVFAGMVIALSKSFLDFFCLTSFLFPFYADELSTMAVRIRDGENILRPHRRHLYQLLANEKGISHWKISVGYGLLQLLVGMSVLLLKPFGSIAVLSILVAYFGAFSVVSTAIRKNLTKSA